MSETNKSTTGRRRTPAAKAGQVYYHRNEAVFVPDGYLAIGRITTAHALQGEVRVELHTDFPERFAPTVTLYIGETLSATKIEYSRPHKDQLLLKLVGVDSRNEAEALRGHWLFIPETEAVQLEDGSYWVHDIIGLQVQSEAGQDLGVISDVLFTGANEVYVIKRADNAPELLLPAIADVVQDVDLQARRMTVRLLPGMLDE
jgi:16S rRNA processing protein RimM